MNEEQLELVSAYVDGEASAEERARVEGDAELLAEVDRLRAIRTALSAVEPPPDAARESAIAAALAAFDAAQLATSDTAQLATSDTAQLARGSGGAEPTPDVTTPGTIVPFDRSRRVRLMRAVSAAAAAAVIVVAGVAIIQRRGDDGAPTAGDAQPALTAAEFEAAAEPTTTSAALAATAEQPPTADNEADASAQAGSAADAMPAPAAAAPDAAGAPLARALLVIENEADLAAVADELDRVRPSEAAAVADCEDGRLVPNAIYRDRAGTEHPIVVVTVEASDTDGNEGVVAALGLDDCTIVLRAEATER